METVFRGPGEGETGLLKDFLYEAIFIPEGVEAPDRSITDLPELALYYEDFGQGRADHCIFAEVEGNVVGAVWSRIMPDYGHVDDDTPSLAISLIGDRMYVSWESFGRFLRKQEKYCYNPGKDPSIVKTGGSVFLNIRQACWYAKVSRPTLVSWCRQEHFTVKRVGNVVRIPLKEFDEWLDRRKEAGRKWHR